MESRPPLTDPADACHAPRRLTVARILHVRMDIERHLPRTEDDWHERLGLVR